MNIDNFRFKIRTKVMILLILLFVELSQAETICSMTFNSNNEINLFKKYHSKGNEFVELLNLTPPEFEIDPLNYKNSNVFKYFSKPKSEYWLSGLCQKRIKCDTLVISGHFAMQFFGDLINEELYLQTMEKLSCSNECGDFFTDIKKIFLFGCNSLSSKKLDKRKPKDYLTDLVMEHSFDIIDADAAVAARYSDLGLTINQKMQNIFPNFKEIYGFESKAPSGSRIESRLSKFVSNYDPDQLQGDYFLKILNGFHPSYISSIKDNPFERKAVVLKKNNSCQFKDERISFFSRANLLISALEDEFKKNEKGVLQYFDDFYDFIFLTKKNINTLEFKDLIREFNKLNYNLKKTYIDSLGLVKDTPYTNFKLLRLLIELNWIDLKSYQNYFFNWLKSVEPISEIQSVSFCKAMSDFENLRKYGVNLNPNTIGLDLENIHLWTTLACANNYNKVFFDSLAIELFELKTTAETTNQLIILGSNNNNFDKSIWTKIVTNIDEKQLNEMIDAYRKKSYYSVYFINWANENLKNPNISFELKDKIERLLLKIQSLHLDSNN